MNNVVVLLGRLTADPGLRYLPNGTPIAEFGVAVNRSIRKPDGSFENTLDGFFDCEHFGDTAVTFAEEFKKGREVYLVGHLLQNKFETKNGQKVSKVIVRVSRIGPTIAPLPKESAQAAAASTSQEQAPAPQPA